MLGETVYSTAVDIWSVGCVFGELLLNEPLFQAKSEIDMLALVRISRIAYVGFTILIAWPALQIFKLLGTPTEEIWPGFSKLPLVKTLNIASQRLVQMLQAPLALSSRSLSPSGIQLCGTGSLMCQMPDWTCFPGF